MGAKGGGDGLPILALMLGLMEVLASAASYQQETEQEDA